VTIDMMTKQDRIWLGLADWSARSCELGFGNLSCRALFALTVLASTHHLSLVGDYLPFPR
jgi:hypothetical protein